MTSTAQPQPIPQAPTQHPNPVHEALQPCQVPSVLGLSRSPFSLRRNRHRGWQNTGVQREGQGFSGERDGVLRREGGGFSGGSGVLRRDGRGFSGETDGVLAPTWWVKDANDYQRLRQRIWGLCCVVSLSHVALWKHRCMRLGGGFSTGRKYCWSIWRSEGRWEGPSQHSTQGSISCDRQGGWVSTPVV